jgi:hypothetical protein
VRKGLVQAEDWVVGSLGNHVKRHGNVNPP